MLVLQKVALFNSLLWLILYCCCCILWSAIQSNYSVMICILLNISHQASLVSLCSRFSCIAVCLPLHDLCTSIVVRFWYSMWYSCTNSRSVQKSLQDTVFKNGNELLQTVHLGPYVLHKRCCTWDQFKQSFLIYHDDKICLIKNLSTWDVLQNNVFYSIWTKHMISIWCYTSV